MKVNFYFLSRKVWQLVLSSEYVALLLYEYLYFNLSCQSHKPTTQKKNKKEKKNIVLVIKLWHKFDFYTFIPSLTICAS